MMVAYIKIQTGNEQSHAIKEKKKTLDRKQNIFTRMHKKST